MQILYLLRTQCKTLLLVVFLKVVHILDGLWLDVNRKNVLVDAIVHALQHLVVLSILAVYGEVLLDAADAFKTHVLGNLNGVGSQFNSLISCSFST